MAEAMTDPYIPEIHGDLDDMTAEEWNALYPIGTQVVAYAGSRDDAPLYTWTRSRAWPLGHGAPVVMVEGHSGGIVLTHVDPAPDGWLMSPQSLTGIDDAVDRDGIYAKGYWQPVDGKNTVVGLRIGADYNDRVVAKFGDHVIRRPDGTYSVRPAGGDR